MFLKRCVVPCCSFPHPELDELIKCASADYLTGYVFNVACAFCKEVVS